MESMSSHKSLGIEKYEVSVLTPDAVKNAMTVLANVWLELEPLAVYTNETFEELYNFLQNLQQKTTDPILSTVATTKKGEIVGVALSTELSLKHQEKYADAIDYLIRKLENLYRDYYLKTKHSGKVVCIDALGVVNKAKGKGLGSMLVQKVIENACSKGYKWCILEASNVYSAHICEKLGMAKIVEIDYDEFEYVDEKGIKTKPFKGLDAFYTDLLNKKRESKKKLTTSAKSCILYEIPL